MVTPAFLYVYGARMKRLEVAAALSMVLVMIPDVLYGATGWAQFGYRFSLDYLPMLAVLTASGMSYRVGSRKWLVICLTFSSRCGDRCTSSIPDGGRARVPVEALAVRGRRRRRGSR